MVEEIKIHSVVQLIARQNHFEYLREKYLFQCRKNMKCVQMCWPIIIILIIFLYHMSWVKSNLDDNQQFCTIKTKSGLIRGKLNRTLFDGKLYYSFRGIPFAKPPINELRFKVIFFFKKSQVNMISIKCRNYSLLGTSKNLSME